MRKRSEQIKEAQISSEQEREERLESLTTSQIMRTGAFHHVIDIVDSSNMLLPKDRKDVAELLYNAGKVMMGKKSRNALPRRPQNLTANPTRKPHYLMVDFGPALVPAHIVEICLNLGLKSDGHGFKFSGPVDPRSVTQEFLTLIEECGGLYILRDD